MKIWKFPIQIKDEQTIIMPEGATILCVQVQGRSACLWAVVDPESEVVEDRKIYVRGTGHPMGAAASGKYIGTVQDAGGALIWHVFDGGVDAFPEVA